MPKIGDTIWYVATQDDQWLALLCFSAAALKCSVRDRWIGRGYRHQTGLLNLVANNSRFMILPAHHVKNLGSQILSLCRQRIQEDWIGRFGYPLLILETFVDPERFHGTIYRAANWTLVVATKGYSEQTQPPKLISMQSLQRNAQRLLSRIFLPHCYQTGKTRMKLTADQMLSLYDCFQNIDDLRRAENIHCPPCYHWQPLPFHVVCAATKIFRFGHNHWGRRHAADSAVEIAAVNMKSPV